MVKLKRTDSMIDIFTNYSASFHGRTAQSPFATAMQHAAVRNRNMRSNFKHQVRWGMESKRAIRSEDKADFLDSV